MGNTSPEILEFAFYAIGLLEQLSLHKLDFVFKGGSSLMLHFPDIKRLSTDIDIVTGTTREELEEILSIICFESHFTRWQLDTKRSYTGKIPKAHYFLFFHSDLSGNEKYILLDVLQEKPVFPEIVERSVKIPSMKNEGDPLIVKTPGLNSLLGDKLTAFAPDTIGVTYASGKHLSMAKQLYDIDMLIDSERDISIVSDTFKISAELEISYLDDYKIIIDDVYNDIRDTAFLFSWGFFNKITDSGKRGKYRVFEKGMAALNSFLPGNKRFTRLDMLIAASKAGGILAYPGKRKIVFNGFLRPENPPEVYRQLYFSDSYRAERTRYPDLWHIQRSRGCSQDKVRRPSFAEGIKRHSSEGAAWY